MARLYGRTLGKDDISARIGQMSQIAGARSYELTSGLAKGVAAVDVRTGSGFDFTVLPSRAMDIAWASYKGCPISYISPTGVVAPWYFAENGTEGFLRNFFAGLLTTGGLTNIGVPCEDDGERLGLHGRISNTPAEDVSVSQEWEGDDYVIRVAGTVRQARVFGGYLLLHRQITTRLGAKSMVIRDVVENAGSRPEPLMVLYHCNFGYPLVDTGTHLHTCGGEVAPRDPAAESGIDQYDRFSEPIAGFAEQCFYHDLRPRDGRAFAALFNEDLGIGAYVRYQVENLPTFVQWKMMGRREYVVGLEPATNRLDGRKEVARRGELRSLAPGERREFEVEIGVLDGKAALSELN